MDCLKLSTTSRDLVYKITSGIIAGIKCDANAFHGPKIFPKGNVRNKMGMAL